MAELLGKVAARRKRIIALAKRGRTIEEIAAVTGLSHDTVRRTVSQVAPTYPRGRLAERRRRVAELAGQGLYIRDIAAEMGLSYEIVSRDLRAIGVKAPRAPKGGDQPNAKTERNAEVVARAKAGETLQEIADTLDITRERVRQIVARAGVPREERGVGRIASWHREYILGRIEEGASAEEIAEEIDIAAGTVRGHAYRAGVCFEKRSNRKHDHEKIKRLLKQGLPVTEIARLVGCSPNTVSLVAIKSDLRRRPYRPRPSRRKSQPLEARP